MLLSEIKRQEICYCWLSLFAGVGVRKHMHFYKYKGQQVVPVTHFSDNFKLLVFHRISYGYLHFHSVKINYLPAISLIYYL